MFGRSNCFRIARSAERVAVRADDEGKLNQLLASQLIDSIALVGVALATARHQESMMTSRCSPLIRRTCGAAGETRSTRPQIPSASRSVLIVSADLIGANARGLIRLHVPVLECDYAHYMQDTILRLTLEHAPNVIGVLSLSEKRDNLLMWAHYAAQHTGFVIGFDSENPALVAQQRRIGRPRRPGEDRLFQRAARPWADGGHHSPRSLLPEE